MNPRRIGAFCSTLLFAVAGFLDWQNARRTMLAASVSDTGGPLRVAWLCRNGFLKDGMGRRSPNTPPYNRL